MCAIKIIIYNFPFYFLHYLYKIGRMLNTPTCMHTVEQIRTCLFYFTCYSRYMYALLVPAVP